MLDLNALRLTDEERLTLAEMGGGSGYKTNKMVANAQFAKTLWGLVDWMEQRLEDNPSINVATIADNILKALIAAGIERPTSE